jgi:hypothetical protein
VRHTGVAVLAVCSALAAGCTAAPPARPAASTPAASTPPALTAELTPTRPTARLPLAPVANPRLVRLNIVAINNPSAQGVTLKAAFFGPAGGPVELGQVSPYPANRPGNLQLAIPEQAADLLGHAGAMLDVTLASLTTEPLRNDVRLVISAAVVGG